MTTVVVDASVAAKWFLPGPGASAASQWLDDRYHLAAPDLIRAEIGNIIWKLHRRGTLDADEAFETISRFLAVPLEIHESTPLLAPALEIAVVTDRSIYDSLYLSLAIELGTAVITADERWVHVLAGSPFDRFLRLLGRD